MDFPKPSTFNPISRRFSNERARELEETRSLYDWVRQNENKPYDIKFAIGQRLYPSLGDVPDLIRDQILLAIFDILSSEPYLQELAPPSFDRMNLQEFVEYRNVLHAKQYFIINQAALLDLINEGLERVFLGLADHMPRVETPSPFTIPLVNTLPEAPLLVDKIYGTFAEQKYADRGLFTGIADKLYRNLCKVSGRDPAVESNRPFKYASDGSLSLSEIIASYLGGTPLEELFNFPVPLKLTHEERFSHMHIVGGTGAGKTTLIERLILHDIAGDDPPSLVIIDPHSDLIRKLSRANLGIEDRIIIIDPRDIEHPPALNVFSLNKERLKGYDEATKEQVTAGVIQTFDYLFSGLIGADLTAKQGVFFRYVARLMLALPDTMGRDATILDMMKLMSDDTPYLNAIASLPPIPREFFERDFRSKTFVQTKEQIRYRLQAILENPTIARLFTSPSTKLDLFTEMNRGASILVDTAKDFLKGASSNFGRIFVSMVLQAVLERAAIPAKDRKATFLFVDEAASYFDSNIDDLLTEARKYRCGLVLAHQYLDQASSSLRASLAANTATKFASGLSASDARAMAHEMRTTPDFIQGQPRLQFAAHIRNVTPQAVSIPNQPVGALPTLSDDAFAALMERNRQRVSLPKLSPQLRLLEQEMQKSVVPDHDISDEW